MKVEVTQEDIRLASTSCRIYIDPVTGTGCAIERALRRTFGKPVIVGYTAVMMASGEWQRLPQAITDWIRQYEYQVDAPAFSFDFELRIG